MGDLRVRRGISLIAVVLGLASPSRARAAPAVCEDGHAAACVGLRVSVRRAGDRVPLSGTRVTVVPAGDRPAWTRVAETDDHGQIELWVPPGRVRVVVLAPGFERFDGVVEATSASSEVLVVLQPMSSNPYRTVVPTRRDVQPGVSPRRLDREEIATVPGAQGDALRALQSLPGVARTPGGLGLLVLRGASPRQSVVFVGEHRVPRAFHALAIASVVPSDALDGVDFVPSNFSSRYGNGTGGAVMLRPRVGRRDGVHGFGEVDLAASGGMVEGPLGPGSFLIAAQRSYVDGFLKVVEGIDPNETFVLPAAWDYQMFIDEPVGRGTTITTRVLGSEDRLTSRFRSGGMIERGLELRAGFHRVDLELRHRSGPWRLLLSPSFRFEHQSLGAGDDRTRRRDYVTSGRAELSARLGPRATLTFGADVELDPFDTAFDIFTVEGPVEEQVSALQTSTGLYATTDLRMGRLTLMPGVRANAFTLDHAVKLSVDPRLLARLEASSKWGWAGGIGLYSQPQLDVDSRSSFSFLIDTLGVSTINRWRFPSSVDELIPEILLSSDSAQVRLAQALHASTALTYTPSSAWTIEVGGYLRLRDESLSLAPDLGGVVIPRFPPVTRNYGVELLLRRHNVGRLYGWVSYTLSWARQIDREQPLARQAITDPFDQRHNLAIVASYALPRHWRIGGRLRVVSGSPYTPIVGAIDQPTSAGFVGVTAGPVLGPENSDRFPLFHQLDLRVDKRWYRSRTIINAYLDVQNVYNRQNVEAYFYSPDYRRKDASLGLPILPSLGLRVDF